MRISSTSPAAFCPFSRIHFLHSSFLVLRCYSNAVPPVRSGRDRLAHFLRQLRQNHFIRLPQQSGQFFVRHRVSRLQRYPLCARQVRCWNNVLSLRQFRKLFRRRLERQTHPRRLERRDRIHLPAHFEQQIVAPLNLFRGPRKRQAQPAQPFGVHAPSLCQNHLPSQSDSNLHPN